MTSSARVTSLRPRHPALEGFDQLGELEHGHVADRVENLVFAHGGRHLFVLRFSKSGLKAVDQSSMWLTRSFRAESSATRPPVRTWTAGCSSRWPIPRS